MYRAQLSSAKNAQKYCIRAILQSPKTNTLYVRIREQQDTLQKNSINVTDVTTSYIQTNRLITTILEVVKAVTKSLRMQTLMALGKARWAGNK